MTCRWCGRPATSCDAWPCEGFEVWYAENVDNDDELPFDPGVEDD